MIMFSCRGRGTADVRYTAPFNFYRYGVRVPAVIVSPDIEQGMVPRARQRS